IGWKAGLTNAKIQAQFEMDEPVCGFLLASGVYSSGAEVPAARFAGLVVEAEVAFVMRQALAGPGVTPARALLAVEGALPALGLGLGALEAEGWRHRQGNLHAARVGQRPLRLMRLSGRVVVITGAGGGIGRSVALAFAAEGADLVLGDLTDSVESAAEDARRIGVKALPVHGDVARVTDMVALVAKAVDELGRL